jgi:2-deoxy-D-gluconate 3-dehydrogenase
LGDGTLTLSLDVRDEDAVQDTVRNVVNRFGSLDILINNAGVGHGGSVLEMPLEGWETVIATNLTGSFLCAKHAGRAMVAGGKGGKIINIGSAYSVYGTPQFADYGSSKTGVLGLTRGLAIELAPHDIQVNAILPGWYETDMTEEILADRGEEIRRRTPAGRLGVPEDLVGAAIFLASDASSFVTGIALPVGGGYLISETITSN